MIEKEEAEEVAEVDGDNADVEMVSLEDADEEKSGGKNEDLPDIDDDSDVELDDDDDSDAFLEADDDEDDDMSDIIGGRPEDEEEN